MSRRNGDGQTGASAQSLAWRNRWVRPARVLALCATILVAAIVAGQPLVNVLTGRAAASATPLPPASPTATITATATTSAPPRLFSYESALFGYRLQLPEGARRSDCLSSAILTPGQTLGGETFTLLSLQQERAETRSDVARGGTVAMWTFSVALWIPSGLSPFQLAQRGGCPSCDPTGALTEAVIVGGREAARAVVDGEARLYVVRANDLIYVIELYANPDNPAPRPTVLVSGILDAVVNTFEPGPVRPSPTRTPQIGSPGPSAQATAVQLAAALHAGDADSVAGLITPRCWLETWLPQAGPFGRAVQPYIADLRRRFASGDLRVQMDPAVQVGTQDGPGRLRFFSRSDWTESGRTTRMDLYLGEFESKWYWAGTQVYAPPP